MDDKSELILNKEQLDKFQDNIAGFRNLMMEYRCAMLEVQTKLEVLNKELSLLHSRNPFESIKSRLKSPESIMEKLNRNGLEYTVENIEKNLNDIAGIRVICSFAEDIYMLVDCLVAQDDIILVEKKDYIKNPKPNGYRSLHLILDIPIFLTKEKKHMRVEVQFRTIAMDFWASLEHKLKYKKNIENAESISEELKYCADIISQLDRRMEQIRNRIDNQVTYS
ncbi:MAG: GTP pyrophosphokinase family protein [Lachnoclostridium sp.]|nr:GTP pyrophosphokinase family protein [Lachnospira sp.]MCM1248966.1 GTP pyrophosphokinase family protein [Lachnoclostridium sp.]MCM1535178.1 GTP pyrophosphokinase family protein [Clostridium sp.]